MEFSTQQELAKLGIGRKIRALRQEKKADKADLAKKVKITPVLLSQIEDEVVTPTVATLLNISKTLGVGIDHFFTDSGGSENYELTRVPDRLRVTKSREQDPTRLTYTYSSLAYRLKGKKMEPFYVEFDPETEEKLDKLSHEGEEFAFCMEGEIEFVTEDKTVRLGPGDSLYFYSSVPHVWRGIGSVTPKAIFVLLPKCDDNQ
jgi:transcriptional regulator with XRE-family HTH domain